MVDNVGGSSGGGNSSRSRSSTPDSVDRAWRNTTGRSRPSSSGAGESSSGPRPAEDVQNRVTQNVFDEAIQRRRGTPMTPAELLEREQRLRELSDRIERRTERTNRIVMGSGLAGMFIGNELT